MICIEVLLGIVILLSFTDGVSLNQRFSMLEYFSGKGHVSTMFRQSKQHRVGSFELRDHPSMNFLSDGGFARLGFIA